ncbi:MAG: hypothetical protein Q4G05_05035 [Clostridia bacterium]|nr:hypothetical protein [Clostridia bacterium]
MLVRLRSPVVWIQLISIIVGLIIYFKPEVEETVKIISTAVISLINVFAGLNNPMDSNHF